METLAAMQMPEFSFFVSVSGRMIEPFLGAVREGSKTRNPGRGSHLQKSVALSVLDMCCNSIKVLVKIISSAGEEKRCNVAIWFVKAGVRPMPVGRTPPTPCAQTGAESFAT